MENTAPRWLLWAGIILLLWNLMGIGVFAAQWSMTAEDIAKLPQIQQDLWNNMPGWAWAAYAVAVVAGTLGAVGVIMRKWWAALLFSLSLIAVLIQFSYPFLSANAAQGGMEMLGLPIFIVVIAAVQWLLSRNWQRKGWLT
jgi:NADH:ubiquinone oxidoreductase subunit K